MMLGLQAVSFILPIFCLDHYSTVTMNSTTVKQRPFTNRFEGVLDIFPSFFFLGMRPRHFFALCSCSWRSLPAISQRITLPATLFSCVDRSSRNLESVVFSPFPSNLR